MARDAVTPPGSASRRIRAKPPSSLKTFAHLAGKKRMPTQYELVSSDLLYYPTKGGFEVEAPLSAWYERYQRGSPLRCDDWERFVDPRQTTYARWVALSAKSEAHADGILADVERRRYDERLVPDWVARVDTFFAPLRFAFHGLQMAASYVGQMAPSGRIVIAAAFQAADEIRRIQRVVERCVLYAKTHPSVGARSRERWQTDPAWQPAREAIERLLVAYDWGESFAALNLVLKPRLDHVFTVELPRRANDTDPLLAALASSFDEDARWHRAWSAALVATATDGHPENRAALSAWVAAWTPLARAAVLPLEQMLEADGLCLRTEEAGHHFVSTCGLEPR